MSNQNELLEALAHFTGTTQYYRHSLMRSFLYTDGVQYLAQHANCYWLIDYVFSNQYTEHIRKEAFQVWKITVSPYALKFLNPLESTKFV